LARAESLYRDALAMQRKLYPEDRFPDGHPDLAASLNNLGVLLQARGELARAEPLLRDAVAMRQKLYPSARFPDGHADLAVSLSNLGALLNARGELARAESLYRDTLAMRQKLYPPVRFPDGHPNLALSFNNLGALLQDRGELARAEPLYRDALAMLKRLYPPVRFPDGHPNLALSFNNLGALLRARGDLARAEPLYRDALAMRQKLYPPARFPDGHPNLSCSLNNLGALLWARGELAPAERLVRRAVATDQRVVSALLAGSAEAEALNYLAQLPLTRDAYLSITRDLPDNTDSAYRALWHAKGAVAQMVQQRRLSLLLAKDQTTRDLAEQLKGTRQALASLLHAGAAARPERVRELSDRKEKLEKQLADKLPLYQALQERLKRGPADLVPLLLPGAVFCDLTRYWQFDRDPLVPGDKGERRTLCYVAFVLARGQPLRRVELGEAGPIDEALAAWRRSLQAGKAASPAALTLRRRLWQPLEKVFPAQTHTVLVGPDAALTGLPWGALPGGKAGTILLEDCAVAVVPNGQFLLAALEGATGPRLRPEEGTLVLVGGVAYGQPPAAIEHARPAVAGSRGLEVVAPYEPVAGIKGKVHWSDLAGTKSESAQLRRLAGDRQVVLRQGTAAGTAQLLADLPRARWAHLATHGFFADPSVHSILQFTPQDYQRGQRGERVGLGARSPLVLSGLVLSGANLAGKDAPADGGILTAEAIAGLDLDGLDLAVLSACETGLGEVAGGEGVFGLQRAFHIAGAKNVVASLWKVDDEATAALMGLFYHQLWHEGKTPLEALRQAQLTLYRHPERIPALARERGPDFAKASRLPAAPTGEARAAARLWAGFVLSGSGK
jgi:CHAT domain-containing protein